MLDIIRCLFDFIGYPTKIVVYSNNNNIELTAEEYIILRKKLKKRDYHKVRFFSRLGKCAGCNLVVDNLNEMYREKRIRYYDLCSTCVEKVLKSC